MLFTLSLSRIFIVTFREHVVTQMDAIAVFLHLGQVKLQIPRLLVQSLLIVRIILNSMNI